MKRIKAMGGGWIPSALLALVIGGLVLRSGAARHALQGPQDPPSPPNHEYFMVAKNAGLVDDMISLFVNYELRNPASIDEVRTARNGLYWRVDPADLINPYTNQSLQWVSQPSAGDLSFLESNPSSYTVRAYYIDTFNGNQLVNWDATATPENLQTILNLGNPPTDDTGLDWQKAQVNRTLWYLLVSGTLESMQLDDYWPPRSYDKLVEWCPLIARIRNPYTGGYIQNVPENQPSEGNFTFTVNTDSNGYVTGYDVKWWYLANGSFRVLKEDGYQGWQPPP